jgi:hypothetical protein
MLHFNQLLSTTLEHTRSDFGGLYYFNPRKHLRFLSDGDKEVPDASFSLAVIQKSAVFITQHQSRELQYDF